jgi:phospholipase/lecithinase/hemolysin
MKLLSVSWLTCAVLLLPLQVSDVQGEPPFSEIVVFGDSGVDTGNFARSSNGPVWVEELAAWFGLVSPQPSEHGGTNYAWGGARTGYELDWVPLMGMHIPAVGMQIQQFLSQHTPDPQQLFVLRAGGNDYGVHNESDPSVLVSNLASHVSDLAAAGAKHILVSNTEPFGYIPYFLGSPEETVANQLFGDVSLLLAPVMTGLDEDLGITIYQFDAHGVMTTVLDDPSRFGLTNVTSPAQHAGGTVSNSEEYMFWDVFHFTTAMHSIMGKAAAETVAARLGDVTLVGSPEVIYDTKDSDSDSTFDNYGDSASSRQSAPAVVVGERDTQDGNAIVRLVAKYDLPRMPAVARRLGSATLRLFLENIEGDPAGPASLFHSVGDNDLDELPSDCEDGSYTDTLLDLVNPSDESQRYYELDVTDVVLADYASDGDDPLSAFRLQINEAEFVEDDQSHRYRFAMPGATTNHPELVLTFIDPVLGDVNLDGDVNGLDVNPFVDVLLSGPYQPEADMNEDQVVNGLDVDPFVAAVVGGGTQQIPEPSTLLLCIIALGVVGGWWKWGR